MSFFNFECGCKSSRFLSSHGGRRQIWNCLIVCQACCFWHAQDEHIYRTEKASAIWRGWVPLKICNVWIFECTGFFTSRWIDSLCLKKANQTWTEELLQMTDGDDHSLWRKLVLAPLQKCHDVYIIHLPTSQLILCPFVSLYICMYQLAGVSVLLLRTLGRFSPQWPLILSCKTWCGCYVEYWTQYKAWISIHECVMWL